MVQHASEGGLRATHIILMALCLAGPGLAGPGLAGPAWAQGLPETGSPEAAFSGGPMRLSKNALALLRSHYQGDKVPLIPQPFRGRLDAALIARDWPKIEVTKKELIAARGVVMALAWEQSRFIATGGVGLAELHARDIAATNSSGVAETAAMLWFYAAAATLTDGHKCADPEAKTTHLASLRGAAYEPVLRIVRDLADARVTAMRDLAIRLESVLAADRNDDTMCRMGAAKPELRPELEWRPDAAKARPTLVKHLTALTALTRAQPVAVRPSNPPAKPVARQEPVSSPPPPSLFPSPSLAPDLDPSPPPLPSPAVGKPATQPVSPPAAEAAKPLPTPSPPTAAVEKPASPSETR